MKYLWNKPTIYVAANQFHHKHEEISSSVCSCDGCIRAVSPASRSSLRLLFGRRANMLTYVPGSL